MASIAKFGTDGAASAGVELPFKLKDAGKNFRDGGSVRATVVTATTGSITSKIELRAATAGTISTVLTASKAAIQTAALGDLVCNPGGLATDGTAGFLFVPSCAGTPTGVPANTYTNCVPLLYDRTANKIWVRNTTWKASAALA